MSHDRPLRVTIPQVATVTGPAGSFRGRGTITVTPVDSALPFAGALSRAGTGVDIAFSGVRLTRPLTIMFDTTAHAPAGAIPVVAHQRPDGAWDLALPSRNDPGQMTIRTQAFSPHLPAWLHPSRWLHWLGDRLASLVGGRTAPISCPAGGPAWASLVKHTEEAHTCLTSNTDQASHAVRAEAQVKSNRGTALEIDIPPGAAYTWVQGQPRTARSWVWAHMIHQDPDLMALLPAGATMTAGFLRPAADENLSFQVRVSYWSLAYSLIGDAVDALSGDAAEATSLTTLYLVSKCSSAVSYSTLSASNPLQTATFASALNCVISDTLTGLSSPEKALSAARSLLGPGADKADLATATNELTSVGGKLLTFGWVLKLWPVLQLGWGGVADVIHSLLTGGTSTLIDLNMRGGPGQAQIVYFRCCGIPVTSQDSKSSSFNDYRPRILGFDATGSHIIESATWQVWNSTEAIAAGTAAINSCQPACAGGRYVKDPVTITLSRPQLCDGTWFWSQAVWHFPDGIPPGEMQNDTGNILFGC